MKTKIAQALEALGFGLTQTGGGCEAFTLDITNGTFLLVTDGEAGAPMDTGSVMICHMSENHGDPIGSRTFDSAADLLASFPTGGFSTLAEWSAARKCHRNARAKAIAHPTAANEKACRDALREVEEIDLRTPDFYARSTMQKST